MKFKFPKTIQIGDTLWEMRYDLESNSGEFIYPFKEKKGFIRIGTQNLRINPNRFLTILIHEFKEIIQVEQATRFTRNDEHSLNSYEFHYSHREHTDLCSRLSGLLTNFIK